MNKQNRRSPIMDRFRIANAHIFQNERYLRWGEDLSILATEKTKDSNYYRRARDISDKMRAFFLENDPVSRSTIVEQYCKEKNVNSLSDLMRRSFWDLSE